MGGAAVCRVAAACGVVVDVLEAGRVGGRVLLVPLLDVVSFCC